MAKNEYSHTIFLTLNSNVLIHVLANFGVDWKIFGDFIAIIWFWIFKIYFHFHFKSESESKSWKASISENFEDIDLICFQHPVDFVHSILNLIAFYH